MSVSIKELWVVPDMAGKIDFLNGYHFLNGGHLLCPELSHWASFFQKLHSDWCQWIISHLLLHWPLPWQPEQCLISRVFLVVPECPTPLLGRDLLGSLGTIKQLGQPEQPHILTLTYMRPAREQGPIPSHILQGVNLHFGNKENPGGPSMPNL